MVFDCSSHPDAFWVGVVLTAYFLGFVTMWLAANLFPKRG
jgi:hypothetical protein